MADTFFLSILSVIYIILTDKSSKNLRRQKIMKAKGLTRETISSLGMYQRSFPEFVPGDAIIVVQKIKEGEKERLQEFEGDVIAIRGKGASKTFTVRRISVDSVAVEKIFPFYSRTIDSIKFVRRGKVRRAKLFYMRDRIGKAARVKEKIMTKEQRDKIKNK